MLFEISPTDPAALGAEVFVMLGVALTASLIPARRAARLDPTITLKTE
jgi:ABC-type lipoprotein release transport system permease subunit